MKQLTPFISFFLAMISLFIFPHCGGGDGERDMPCPPLSIETIFPNNNPVGGPVLIKGEGYTSVTEVYFGQVRATIEEYNQNHISTTIPSGLSGLVELSVDNGGECIRAEDFEVVADFPADLPSSPPIYVIPPAGFSFPPQVGSNETMFLVNLYDENHELKLALFKPITANYTSAEETLDGEKHPIMGGNNLEENWVSLEIDRSPSGLPNDKLEGGFYTMTAEVNGETITDNFLIMFSTITGRQYFFYLKH